jgi:predicted transcriptional regulator
MTAISGKEFAVNQQKYFNLAINEDVCIKNGENMFHFMYSPVEATNKERVYKKPDADFYSAITMEKLLENVLMHIDELDKKYTNK